MLLNILVSVIGSIIGLELIARLGISTNTSIIGALFAIIIARIPLKIFQKYKDINTQNLVQTAMSGATFAASNGIFLSIGIPYLLGRQDLVIPMLIGASLAVIIDATILYRVFDTEMFPAKEAWAPVSQQLKLCWQLLKRKELRYPYDWYGWRNRRKVLVFRPISWAWAGSEICGLLVHLVWVF